MLSWGGSLLPSIYADARSSDADIVSQAKHNNHIGVVRLLTAAVGAGAAASPLPSHIAAILAAESSLLPPPPAVNYWLQGGSPITPAGEPHYDLAREAVAWLISAAQSAYLSPRIKQAGGDLIACQTFTRNLDYLRCWSQILIPALTATLEALGAKAKEINAASHKQTVISTASIVAVTLYNTAALPEGAATPRDRVRQDTLMPSLTAAVSTDFNRDWKEQPEHIYVHVLLLIAAALNPLFGAALEAVLSELGGVQVDLHDARIKSFTRMINKLVTAGDHRYVEQRPRPAMNIDVVRRLVSAATPDAVLELVKRIAARFGGLSHLKCLPELATVDPEAADARYHMLPVMVTVVFAPAGLTVGGLLSDPNVRAAWAELRTTRPSKGVSSEQWQLDHDTAVKLLETKCDPNEPVQMHCEVQVVTTALAGVRREMHQVYKLVRASDGAQLYADVSKPEVEAAVDVDAILMAAGSGGGGNGNGNGNGGAVWGLAVWEAANDGRIATIKRLLEACGEGSGGGGSGVDVNWQLERTGSTPLWMAAQNGHISAALVLLGCGADPNLARTDDGSTPMCIAAQYGHFDMVKLLLENNANPNQARSNDGATPLYIAVEKGHVDVSELLMKHAANPDQATTKHGASPLYIAACKGDFGAVTLMLKNNADANAAITNGQTPLYAAACTNHTSIVGALLAAGARPSPVDVDDGQTAISIAAQQGHLAVIKLLVDAGGATGTALTTNGATDLWLACHNGHADVAFYLASQPNVEINRRRSGPVDADAAADADSDGHPGTTPLEAAVLQGHTGIADMLKQHGAV